MNKPSSLNLSLKFVLLFVSITVVLAMHNCIEPLENTYNITFRGSVVTSVDARKPLHLVRIYIENKEPADNYAEAAKNRKPGADANSAIDGTFKIVYPVQLPNDEAIAKAQAQGTEIKTTVNFWLAYVYYKKDESGNTTSLLRKKQVSQEIIIVPGAKTQKSYSLGEQLF